MARKVIVFDDFTKGEFGLANPIEYSERPKSGLWTGSAMTVLPDGSLCPLSVPAAQSTSLPALAGAVVDMGMGSDGSASRIWFKAGNTTYQSGAGPTYTFTANTGTSANTASFLDRVPYSTGTLAVTSTNVLEAINHATGAIAAVGGTPPACATVAVYGDRVMLGGTGAAANRLYFSAAGNVASWPAANFIDVGDAAPIVALVPMRGFLLIAKAGGSDATWWTLRGVPGVNAVLRRASTFLGPTAPNNVALLGDNRVTFATPTFNNGASNVALPAFFDGTTGRLEALQVGGISSGTATEAYRLADGSDLILKQQTQALIRRRGAWLRMSIPTALRVNTSNFATTARSVAPDATAATLSVMNTAGDTFYKWHPYATRPPFTTDTDGAAPSSAFFTLPEWRALGGEEVQVVGVVVGFKKWNTGDDAVTNAFTVTPSATGCYADGSAGGLTVAGTAGTFAEVPSASSSSSSGTQARVTLSCPTGFGNGFKLAFTNVRGVAVQSVAVVVDTRPMQGL